MRQKTSSTLLLFISLNPFAAHGMGGSIPQQRSESVRATYQLVRKIKPLIDSLEDKKNNPFASIKIRAAIREYVDLHRPWTPEQVEDYKFLLNYTDNAEALLIATRENKYWLLSLLAENQSYYNLTDGEGNTALELAMRHRARESIEQLVIPTPVAPAHRALMHAIRNNYQEGIDLCLYGQVHRRDTPNPPMPHFLTEAIKLHQTQTALKLIGANALCERQDKDNMLPIHLAAQLQNTEILAALIAHKVCVATVDYKGNTALHWLAQPPLKEEIKEETTKKILSLLTEAGLGINTKNEDGQTPLMLAFYWGYTHPVIAEELLKQAPEINVQDKKGWTALDYLIEAKKIHETLGQIDESSSSNYFERLQKAVISNEN